jgi:hypothetical protein
MHACTKGGDANRRERGGSFTRKQSERNFVGGAKEREVQIAHRHITENSSVAWSTDECLHITHLWCVRAESFEFADPFRGVMVPDGSWCGALSFDSHLAGARQLAWFAFYYRTPGHYQSTRINHWGLHWLDRVFLGHFTLFIILIVRTHPTLLIENQRQNLPKQRC